ncbi:hypothetical protein N6H13_25860 [Paenibacillus sp. CC-CFT742]|nr:hypothetical protein [Paenibacillus sp. CC-CFT742]WJH28421.1 hypothetical protein N6H13_25860 [Paenibacillus sp. CC-CFT742]
MPTHQQLQQRIKLLQQMQFENPETANWFDESLEHLISEDCNKEIE